MQIVTSNSLGGAFCIMSVISFDMRYGTQQLVLVYRTNFNETASQNLSDVFIVMSRNHLKDKSYVS